MPITRDGQSNLKLSLSRSICYLLKNTHVKVKNEDINFYLSKSKKSSRESDYLSCENRSTVHTGRLVAPFFYQNFLQKIRV